MKKLRTAIAAGLLIACAPLLAQEKPAPAAKEGRTAYLRRIFEKDRATYGDACRAVLSLIKQEHTDADFGAVSGDLSGRGVVSPSWTLTEPSLLTKGTLAYMLSQALDIKGGLTMRIFGVSRRYALRECQHRGLISGGSSDEYVTGRELIDVITNATVYKEQGNTDSQYK
ncbi:MAG TPA: hypothetical protein VE981_14220 [Planctomycetota bacterium]|nr:hypothetical protein [Planctomycetota bacterium]